MSFHSFIEVRIRSDADWMMEIQGILGIVEILGAQHLMVIREKQEVAILPHKHHPFPNTTASIFEL